ncbi:MAG: hypothetical protein A2X34_09140 [Elusimicrobia bacterium GWC2_51_8]|nr:MAG: hypothetical protein A2X33_06555 [Elusimicrobia bacterium GWA2_51_34]OGR57747.1 MAG: hypothetical protein A2X34_09140 [Elusimicrobia bacterium GWC2_51_8]OGR87649.1 MAG: hypothetical protein A2021_02165 [Elusimicrobia bacterium GWF2_52_66]HAF95349.1 hypothetical protein [Elusimicrobiota bacterium]HCE97379.1 hypothetical protein [Elusimicrobiota bacterium]
MKRYHCVFLCPLLVAVLGCSSAVKKSSLNPAYETELVEAEGMSPVVNGDTEGAKKAALHDAMRNALGLVVGIYVSQDAMVSKSILIDENITSQTEGYIEKYEVLRESREGDFYKTKIRAHVRKEDLSAKLRQLETEPQKLGNPIIGFDIKEAVDGKDQPSAYAELELKNGFAEAGFMTGEKDKADILIKGSARSDFNTREGLGGFVSYRASLSVNAVKQGSDETLTTAQETAGGIDLNDSAASRAAIINAAKKSANGLRDKVLKALREKSMVRLNLSNVASLNDLSDFMKSLRNIPVVRDCWLRNYSGSIAAVDVAMRKGGAADLSQLLIKNSKRPLSVGKTSSYELDAAFK